MTRVLVLLFVLSFGALLPRSVSATDISYQQAIQQCQATGHGTCFDEGVIGSGGGVSACAVAPKDANGNFLPSLGFGYSCSTAPPKCTQGQVVPPGTTVSMDKAQGVTCLGTCSLSLALGGPLNGQFVMSGNTCPSTTGTSNALTPPSDTVNADGGHTLCDTISGKCVTTHPSTANPAPATSSGNHSTDTTATTTTAPTTSTTDSSSTSTATGGDDGTGGDGSGSTTTTTGTSTTTTPASSSTTSSKCTEGACDVGEADGQIGTLYTAGTDTPSGVYASFKAKVAGSPLIGAATAFFTVNASGSCPTWHIPGNKYWGEAGFDFTFFCDPAILAIFALAGYVVLAVAAFSAFRIALY